MNVSLVHEMAVLVILPKGFCIQLYLLTLEAITPLLKCGLSRGYNFGNIFSPSLKSFDSIV